MDDNTLISRLSSHLLRSPARMSILGFALLIAVGTVLLMLPACSTGLSLGFIDALFMSTSASCVTGLSVLDISRQLTLLGQLVILLLIQMGGLGILTVSTLLLMMMKGRPTLSGQAIIKDTFTYGEGKQTVASVLRAIFISAFSIEAAGALFLYLRTAPDAGWTQAAYPAVFHAVSAFCNAGFSLYRDSFVGYREDWIVNGVLSVLIIIGGIGFVVIADVKNRFLGRKATMKRLSLHSRLALSASAVLILLGTLGILCMEWDNTLSPLGIPDRLLAALFQSISARTAGFNTLDMGIMANETLFMLCILMFIGACPGSCGGGVKTTTVAGLAVLGISRLKGFSRPQVFRRTLTEAGMSKATSVVMVSAAAITLAVMVLKTLVCDLLRDWIGLSTQSNTFKIHGENDMAKNFRVLTKGISNQSLALQLFGDFDGSSACELINVLDESVKKTFKVAIDTDGLKTINTFGLNVFLPRMSWLNNTQADIEVTGRFSEVFREA